MRYRWPRRSCMLLSRFPGFPRPVESLVLLPAAVPVPVFPEPADGEEIIRDACHDATFFVLWRRPNLTAKRESSIGMNAGLFRNERQLVMYCLLCASSRMTGTYRRMLRYREDFRAFFVTFRCGCIMTLVPFLVYTERAANAFSSFVKSWHPPNPPAWQFISHFTLS